MRASRREFELKWNVQIEQSQQKLDILPTKKPALKMPVFSEN